MGKIFGILLVIVIIVSLGFAFYYFSLNNPPSDNSLNELPNSDSLIGTWSRVSRITTVNGETTVDGASVFDGAHYFFREGGEFDAPTVETGGKILHSNYTYYVENNTIFYDSAEEPSSVYSEYGLFEISGDILTLNRSFYTIDNNIGFTITTLERVE